MTVTRRRRKVNVESKEKAEKGITRLNEIAQESRSLLDQIDVLQASLDELGVEASGLMSFLEAEEIKVPGYGTHLFKPGRTNAKNVVDPKGFMEAVGENAFFSVVTVPMGEAKKHLGEKELNQITDHTPGGPTPPVYKFKP